MILQKCLSNVSASHTNPTNISTKVSEDAHFQEQERINSLAVPSDIDLDIREVYFLIMQFLSAGPCQKTLRQFWNELLEHQLLPRRYHAWYSRSGMQSEDKNDDGVSFPLAYEDLVQRLGIHGPKPVDIVLQVPRKLFCPLDLDYDAPRQNGHFLFTVELRIVVAWHSFASLISIVSTCSRYSHIQTDHLVKLLKRLMLIAPAASISTSNRPNAVDVPTLLGTGSFSLLSCNRDEKKQTCSLPAYLRWPHVLADQVHGLSLRAIGGFARHHRVPSVHTACLAIAKPSTMVQKMQNIKKMRGHRNAVYCAIFDRLGRYVITGSDDRLVKIWSMETAFCLASCRGHEGDITDLAVSSNNALVASASNDFVIRVWRLPDGIPISVLQGHTGTVTAIAFNPRTSASTVYQLLSSSDDGTCRIWDARYSQCKPRIYEPRRIDIIPGRNNVSSSSGAQQNNQILCCAFNANGTVFVTGSSDTLARVWSTYKSSSDDSGQPNHEVDILSGHENDVNYVQFSGCAVTPRSSSADALKEENTLKFKNSGLSHDNIVTCSRDGSAIIWIPRSRRYHGKAGRWMKAYHLKVPPPPLPPRPPRGGPRQRILPTPRGVNMIAWSLDNRFVLAAIMDCRICVWNAADGSLVHSLTGHTESTYVLDVHPFNPRIAMSAGYDGKTIIWDIWEGTPVRIFEIGHYKLVDGKFSQDGTSIVLSDDVGQIYLLGTGEGESQKDAKYDQFFLGDYRPLIRDAIGTVLDQETQLAPHRRNFQDLLCDSSMIPYTEPYQSMYQRRRLGALGMEWRPSSINFATGPDFSLGEDFPMMPIMDLDAIFDVPEIVDLTLWEPEIEARSDDADSEYNVSEEHVSEREHESLSTSPYSDSDSDARDIEAEERQNDGRRRSKRKKAEFTASGRRIKRKNSDSHGSKKVKVVHRGFKKKYRKASASRPKRSAALNAMSALAQFSETDSDGEDMDGFESDSSESESLQSVEPAEDVDSMVNGGGKRRLVLKLPIRDPKKSLLSGVSLQMCDDPNKAGPSSSAWAAEDKSAVMHGSTRSSSVNATDPRPVKGINRIRFKVKGVSDQVGGGTRAAVEEKTNKEEEKVASPGKLTSGDMLDMPGGSHHEVHLGSLGPTNGSAIQDSCVEDLPVSSDISPKTEGLPGLRGKDKICDGSIPHDVKENTGPLTTKVKFTHSGFADKRSHKHNLVAGEDLVDHGESSSARAGLAGDCWDREEDVPIGRNFSEYASIDLPEAETDAVRRTRSTEIKPSSRQPNVGKYKLRVRKTDPSEGTSNSAESPPNRWLSNPQTALNSRSCRSRNSSVYVDEPSPLSISQPNFDFGKTSWLMLYDQEPGYRYIPQFGDEVAYMRQGHQEFMASSGSQERGPWLSTRAKIRAVELCVIEGLDYATVPSGESCCKITLRFADPSSNVFDKRFKLTLPELANFPDFLVEKSWYDVAVGRNWSPGEKCLVWWRNENGEGGSWWDGHVLSSEPKSNDFPDSPWERYTVEYRSEPSNDTQLHCPWELHDVGCTWDPPHLDYRIKAELLDYVTTLEKPATRSQDSYGIQKLNQVSVKSDFVNRFPVPISPQLIKLRLQKNYYRSLEAVRHDIDVMISNASAYFSSRNPEFASKMQRLAQHFRRKLSGF